MKPYQSSHLRVFTDCKLQRKTAKKIYNIDQQDGHAALMKYMSVIKTNVFSRILHLKFLIFHEKKNESAKSAQEIRFLFIRRSEMNGKMELFLQTAGCFMVINQYAECMVIYVSKHRGFHIGSDPFSDKTQ